MPYPLRRRSRSAAVLAALLLAAGSTVASGEANRIEFVSIEQAIPTAAAQEEVTVVYFTADGCGWCRKMESTTFPDPAVRALTEPFVFAEIDAHAQAHLAAMFDARGLPAVRGLNASGELLEEINGYLPPTRFAELLREHRDSATRPGAARQRFPSVRRVIADLERPATNEQTRDAVTRAVALLAETEVFGRTGAEQAITQLGSTAWPTLVELLTHKRLALRAAAIALLRAPTDHDLPYDPFAPSGQRTKQAAAWQSWAEQHAAREPRPAAQDRP